MSEEAEAARDLLRRARSAALATALDRPAAAAGWPFASLVTVACDCDGSPLLLLSDLSDHTRNLRGDRRASLLVEAASHLENPQAGPRVTVIGRLARTGGERHARRFLAHHPGARAYAGFGDFHFYAMTVERARFVGGFARATWLEGTDLRFDAAASEAVAACEADVVDHMNRRHADAVALYANVLLGRRGKAWEMIGVDPEGADLRLRASFARLSFSRPVKDADSCRRQLIGLARKARRRLGG